MRTESSVNDPEAPPCDLADLINGRRTFHTISRNHDGFSDMYRVDMTGPPSEPDLVRAHAHAVDEDGALRHVAHMLASASVQGMVERDIHVGLRAREAVASTNIGSGIAIPHFIDIKVTEARVVVITLESPIKWGPHEEPVDIVFGLSGTPQEPWRHVRSLAHLARLASLPGFAARLRDARDDAALRRVFAEEATRHG
jgi:mannitol/fructose-specific phosphotransferase system IIA component (Ntr-type)